MVRKGVGIILLLVFIVLIILHPVLANMPIDGCPTRYPDWCNQLGICVDFDSDSHNCGGCNHVCNSNQFCNAGSCFLIGGCSVNSDCNDNSACTTDVCSSGLCTYITLTNCCSTNSDCESGQQCVGAGPGSCSGTVSGSTDGFEGQTCTQFTTRADCMMGWITHGCHWNAQYGNCVCASHASSACYNGNVWWYNGCGNPEALETTCTSGQTCEGGVCHTNCIPATCSSLGKSCGSWSDGCGGSPLNCGSCSGSQTCNSNGQCVCAPSCSGKVCGSDGCSGTCGSCGSNQACSSGTSCTCNSGFKDCDSNPLDGCEVNIGNNLLNCGSCGNICSNTNGVASCSSGSCGISCSGGYGNCDGSASNGCETNTNTNTNNCGACGHACSSGDICVGGNCVCVKQCSGKTCGSDGCGGSCGSCSGSTSCNGVGQCVSTCTDTCNSVGYKCGTVCGQNCGSCSGSQTCQSGTCVCSPSCSGKECGSNGCGGQCGSCGSGETCSSGGQCTCTDTCSNHAYQCGSHTICGSPTNCGSCGSGYSCSLSGQCTSSCTDTCSSTGYECGTVCGQNCGSCSGSQTCQSGTCVDNAPTGGCGDRTINSGEGCDDGNTNSGDGCSSTCQIENGWTCSGEPSSCHVIASCGSNGCEPAKGENCETCDADCGCSNGETCQSGTCVQSTTCGDGTCNNGETCSSCPTDCTWNVNTQECVNGNIVPLCDLTSAAWSKTSALENDTIKLNINETNCDGKTISFEVMRKNNGFLGLGQDVPATKEPVNIVYGSPDTYGSWKAEWVDDSPLRYYFIATVEGTSNSITSSKADADMLHVFQRDAVCAGVSSCSNYNTQSDCETNLCTAGDVPSTITCGGSFNPETGCYDYTNCGCSWDSVSGMCGANWDLQSSCGVCGNYIRDTGEQCDLGIRNGQPNSGCTSTCQFENGISSPCPEGTTLCSDDTCSLNCDITDTSVAPCNYNGVCDSGEGCTCSDCDEQQDTCQNGLLCTIFNTACCTSASDLICNPACSYIDPDCSPAVCGDGFRETGEECDLGTRNQVANSGCSIDCKYEILTPPCPEGTALCSDGTCSLNCYATDKGVAACDNSKCAVGLQCSNVDNNACCHAAPDGICNPYCAYVDQDCRSKNTAGVFPIGTCSYTENGQDTCQNGGVLVRSLVASWTWDPANTQQSDPLGKSQNCIDIQDTLACPASVEVSFFGFYQLAIAVVVVVLIYLIWALRKKSSSKPVRRNSKNIGKKRKK